MKRIAILSVLFATTAFAAETKPTTTAPTTKTETTKKATETAPTTTAATTPEATKPLLHVTGFSTPESVLFDEASDRYLVSNINGSPLGKDNNGFISVLSPDGKIADLKWIEGGKNGVTLNAPKGTAIVKGTLYVADIDTVRTFDAKTGAPAGDVAIAGASFLNDIVAGTDGKVYVSDSGMKQGAKDFEPTGTDGVWVIEGKTAKPFFASKDLKGPNGIAFSGKDMIVATFGANEIFKLDAKGMKEDTKLPSGGLDGLFADKDGNIWVSSWAGSAIYKGQLGKTFTPVVVGASAPADFGVDTKRGRILLPRFMDNAVDIFTVQ